MLLMLVGVAMLVRGTHYCLRNGLGWQGYVLSGVPAILVFALGMARWRFLRKG